MYGVIINPSLFKVYHCAVLSCEQDQGIANFNSKQIHQFLETNADADLGEVCRDLTSYWGSILRLDGMEVTCKKFCTSDRVITLYLIFYNQLERLETRVTKLGYLFNQKTVLILPIGEKVRRYTLHSQDNVFSPTYKERDFTDIDCVIHYYFRYIYQWDISGWKEYKENWRFYKAGVMSKAYLNRMGKSADKRLAQIEAGQKFDIDQAIQKIKEKEQKNEKNCVH
ncbi:hypothetical protein [Mannheimia massilioguelmaensis]|uniref:hypothetical protein n=1 Tax=Mannheimia massilioguelmaensis TaxID=1604354 RepID=UPI0005C81601|nr:hypothetical protein [Mannheimia massilioguelmaensis]